MFASACNAAFLTLTFSSPARLRSKLITPLPSPKAVPWEDLYHEHKCERANCRLGLYSESILWKWTYFYETFTIIFKKLFCTTLRTIYTKQSHLSLYLLISFPGVNCMLTIGVPLASYRIVIPGVLPRDNRMLVPFTAVLFSVVVLLPTSVLSFSEFSSAVFWLLPSLSLFSDCLSVSWSLSATN